MSKAKRGLRQGFTVYTALLPMLLTVIFAYIGTILWSLKTSFTASRTFPSNKFIGLDQYVRLFTTERWQVSIEHLILFGVLFILACLVIGFLLAVFIDQNVRGEGLMRAIFLYPYAMSFVATGLIWQWVLNPTLGIQAVVRNMGFPNFEFDWIVTQDKVMYTIVIAAVWQGTGLVMALMLAGLRGIDDEIWRASRVDGIPRWKTYLYIVIPMLRPVVVTALVIVAAGIVRTYDLVVAMTGGGPGLSSQFPTLYVYEFMFVSNLSQGLAASTVMLITVAIIVVPWAFFEFGRRRTR